MKGKKIFTALVGVLFIIIVVTVVASLKSSKELNDKIELSRKQFKFLNDKIDGFDMNISSLKLQTENFKNDYEKYLKVLSERIGQPEQIKTEIKAQAEGIQKQMQVLEENYKTTLSQIKEQLDSLKKEMDERFSASETKVDLGEISVKKEKTEAQ